MRSNGRFLAIAMLLAVTAADAYQALAWGEEKCRAEPNTPAPSGGHWYFHFDHSRNRKCWHLRVQGEGNEPSTVTTRPAEQISKTLPDQSAYQQLRSTPATPSELTDGAASTGGQASEATRAAVAAAPAWPAYPTLAVVDNATWSTPPMTLHQQLNGAVQSRDPISGDDASGDRVGPERPITAEAGLSQREMPVAVLFIIIMGLVIAGVFVAGAVKMILRRLRLIFINRRKSVSLDTAHKLIGSAPMRSLPRV